MTNFIPTPLERLAGSFTSTSVELIDGVLVTSLAELSPFTVDDGNVLTRVAAYTGEGTQLDNNASHFITVYAGTAELGAGKLRCTLDAECYASLSGAVTIEGEARALIISTLGYRCAPLVGGPAEERGRLLYVDGCTASVLLPPPLRGEPCLNFMHLPPRIAQTMHTHPSLRCGLILSGNGLCGTEKGMLPFRPGTMFLIPPDTPHSFQSGTETLRIIIYHPDSDSGPTHEDHTMLNRTFVGGQSARGLPEIHTPPRGGARMTLVTSELQRWDAGLYDTKARFVGDLAEDAVAMLAPRAGERILDIGCGDGRLSLRLQREGAEVIGVDYSPELVAAARGRGVTVHHINAERMAFRGEFDAAFSNAALHWMRDAQALSDGVARALKPGGRFVAEFAGAGNAAIVRREVHAALARRGIDPSSVDPWYLPTAEAYQAILEASAFEVAEIALFDRPVRIDYPISQWIRTFGSPYLTVLPNGERDKRLDEVTQGLEPDLLAADGHWTIDYTRLRFRAIMPQ